MACPKVLKINVPKEGVTTVKEVIPIGTVILANTLENLRKLNTSSTLNEETNI
jgi:hypothetical protein